MKRLSFAVVAQLVEHKLPKLGVEGSNPFRRSHLRPGFRWLRGRALSLVVHRVLVMHRVMKKECIRECGPTPSLRT